MLLVLNYLKSPLCVLCGRLGGVGVGRISKVFDFRCNDPVLRLSVICLFLEAETQLLCKGCVNQACFYLPSKFQIQFVL